MVGDIDNLGGAINAGDTSFLGPFDNRSPAELAATDGAQNTDWARANFGTSLANPTFVHSYAAFSNITSATWEVGIGGLETLNDTFLLDEVVFAAGNQLPDQGAFGYGVLSFTLTGALLNELLDGSASFRLHLNTNDSGEPVVFDFARLTIEGDLANRVPEPATLALVALGALGARRLRARR